MPGRFFDSNILLYMLSDDRMKRSRAADLVLAGGTISVQVLNEVAHVCRRKMRLSWPTLNAAIVNFESLLTVTPLTSDMHHKGLAIAERYQLATYDAMIVASALRGDCDTLFSEDMQNGLLIDGALRIVNPFAHPGSRPGT